MKKSFAFLLIFLILAGTCTVSAQETEYTLLTEAYVRPLGGTEVVSAGRSMNFSSSGISFCFTGTKAEIHVSQVIRNTSSAYDEIYFTVEVDGKRLDERLALPQTGWFTIADNLENREHTLEMRRSDEGARGRVWADKIRVDGENGVRPTQTRARRMEFIGDSYTVGYGNMPMGISNEGRYGKNGDNYYTYAAYTARHYNADYQIAAYSGKGAYINYPGTDIQNEMADMIKYADVKIDGSGDTPGEWDYSSYRPQIVSVFLGTNDEHGISVQSDEAVKTQYEQNFSKTYKNMIMNIREKYPMAHIILISKPSGCMKSAIDAIYNDISQADRYIHRFVFDTFPTSGIHSHPNAEEHMAMSEKLTAFIDSLADSFGEDLWQEEIRLQTSVNTADSIVKVTLSGNRAGAKLSVFVTKPGTIQSNLTAKDSIVYVNQLTADEIGNAELTFSPQVYNGMYNIFVGFENSSGKLTDTFGFRKFIPKIVVKRNDTVIEKAEQIKSGDKLTVILEVENTEKRNYDGRVFCAEYSGKKLIDVKSADICYDNTENQSVSFDFNVGEVDSDSRFQIMFWEKDSLNPLTAVYKISD